MPSPQLLQDEDDEEDEDEDDDDYDNAFVNTASSSRQASAAEVRKMLSKSKARLAAGTGGIKREDKEDLAPGMPQKTNYSRARAETLRGLNTKSKAVRTLSTGRYCIVLMASFRADPQLRRTL